MLFTILVSFSKIFVGHARAQFNVGVAYLYGDGVEPSSSKAEEWWRQAAAQGEKNAIKQLHLNAVRFEKEAAKYDHLPLDQVLEQIIPSACPSLFFCSVSLFFCSVSSVFHRCFIGVSSVFHRCFIVVSSVFHLVL